MMEELAREDNLMVKADELFFLLMADARFRWDRRYCRQLEYVRKDIRQVHRLTLTWVNPNLG